MSPPDAASPRPRLPGAVWALGATSLCMDLSSELIHSLLPVFMVSVLGASLLEVGLVEGMAEATAALLRVFSGALSDRLGARKSLAVAGYALAAAVKPLFPLADSIAAVAAARFLDRVGKGIRGAPRDALVADVTPPEVRGAAYGLRQSLDTVGAFAGPLAAMALLAWVSRDLRTVLWFAVPAAWLAVAVLVFGVREVRRERPSATPGTRLLSGVAELGAPCYRVIAFATLLQLARFSEAFLVLRASSAGLAIALVPLVLVVMNATYALAAYPAGVLADRVGVRGLLGLGLVALVAADLVLAGAAGAPLVVLAGVALWGLHMGLSQGLVAAALSAVAPVRLRGTAFGLYHLASGIAMFGASVLAGGLWEGIGPRATFLAGGLLGALAIAALPGALRERG